MRIENVSIKYEERVDYSLGFSIQAVNIINITPEDPSKEMIKKAELKSLKIFEARDFNTKFYGPYSTLFLIEIIFFTGGWNYAADFIFGKTAA